MDLLLKKSIDFDKFMCRVCVIIMNKTYLDIIKLHRRSEFDFELKKDF